MRLQNFEAQWFHLQLRFSFPHLLALERCSSQHLPCCAFVDASVIVCSCLWIGRRATTVREAIREKGVHGWSVSCDLVVFSREDEKLKRSPDVVLIAQVTHPPTPGDVRLQNFEVQWFHLQLRFSLPHLLALERCSSQHLPCCAFVDASVIVCSCLWIGRRATTVREAIREKGVHGWSVSCDQFIYI